MNKYEKAIERLQTLMRSGFSLYASYSGGKDSTCCVILLLEAIKRLINDGEHVPQCYISNTNTRREMPQIHQYLEGVMTKMTQYAVKNGLPVEVMTVEPPLTSRFTWTTVGRGKLPRYVGAKSRDCAIDEKIRPSNSMVKRIESQASGKVIALVGSRLDESSARGQSMAKYSMDEITISEVDGLRTFAMIADFDLDDVWDLIIGCTENDAGQCRLYSTFTADFSELIELYRDANEGTCGVIIGDKGNASPCGSRFGCAWCLLAGDEDKSLSSMIRQNPESYGYMSGLLKIRSWLMAVRWDMNRRDYRGRSISKANFIKVTPDYFDARTKRELYRYLLTLDALEVDRAKEHERRWHAGEIAKTEQNRLLCRPMFQFITYPDVIAIEWQWSLNRDFDEVSPAARDWIEVHELSARYHIPDLPKAPRVDIPSPRWFSVNGMPSSRASLLTQRQDGSRVNVHFDKSISVTEGSGFEYISIVRQMYHRNLNDIEPSEISKVILDRNWLTMKVGALVKYEEIARRNEYIYRLMKQSNPIMIDPYSGDDKLMTMTEFLNQGAITDKEHREILRELEREILEEDEQIDLIGVDSIVDARENASTIRFVRRKSDRVVTNSVAQYEPLGQQVSLF
ncbi:TPA: hypothetical protein I7682_17845 [Vibrio vulnificus]|nr:hypothetical protein [Vibrio vulnificus]